MITFIELRPCDLGIIPTFLHIDDPRPAREQFNERYAHGGGWRPMTKWDLNLSSNVADIVIKYPEDPPMKPLAYTIFGGELILFFDYAFVCIIQKDGSFEISRMD